MTIITRRGLKRDGASIAEIYKDYKKEKKNHITKETYEKVVAAVHKKLFDKICERKNVIQLSHSLGGFYVHCYVPVQEKHRPIDHLLSKQYGRKIYIRNSHSDGKRFRVIHKKNPMLFALNAVFKFRMCRLFNRELAQRIFRKEIPSWT